MGRFFSEGFDGVQVFAYSKQNCSYQNGDSYHFPQQAKNSYDFGIQATNPQMRFFGRLCKVLKIRSFVPSNLMVRFNTHGSLRNQSIRRRLNQCLFVNFPVA